MDSHASLSESFMDCNICIQLANDPVVTTCGHLFCWPCLHTWLNSDLQPHSCPVCRAYLTRDVNIIPVYQSEKNTSSHANNTNSDGATISSRPRPPHFWHSSSLRGSNPMHMEELEGRYIEMMEEFARIRSVEDLRHMAMVEELERMRSYEEHYLHTINTLSIERDGLRSEIDRLRRAIEYMWPLI